MKTFSILILMFSLFGHAAPEATNPLKFDLSNWPTEIQNNLIKNIPELTQTQFSEDSLNALIKKIYMKTHFKKIKIIQNGKNLLLSAEIDSKVDEIVFKNTQHLSDDDAQEIINLSIYDAGDTSKVKVAVDKLINHYKNLGYQKASAQFQYENTSEFKRKLIITAQVGQKTVIQSIVFNGLDSEDTLFLKNNIYWNYVGENLTDEHLKKILIELRTLLNRRGLYLVNTLPPQIIYNANDTKVELRYQFSNKPKYEIKLVGSKNFSEFELKTDVLKLSEYTASDVSFPDEILARLQKFYYSRAYNQNDIKYLLSKENDRNILNYSIKENVQTRIRKINIVGNISRPEKFYIKEFFNNASAPVQDGLFIKSDLDQAAKNLIVNLKNHGFINAKLKKIELSSDFDHPELSSVSIFIEEGLQTKITEFQIENNTQFKRTQLIESMQLVNTNLLDLNELETGLIRLRAFYANQGYLEMQITNLNSPELITYNDDFTKAKILLKISEGPQIYVGSILIDGNVKTHEKVILSEIEFKPKDLLTPQKLEESTARLQKTGLFSSIEIKMLESNTTLSERTVIISLGERKPGILTTGVGITNENDFTVHGYSGIAYRNIGGWGRGISLRGEGSYNPTILNFLESKVTVGFLEPYLFDSRVRFRVNYTTSRTVSDYTIRQKTITNQAVWSVEQDITSHLTGIWQIYNIANYVDEGITRTDEIKYNYTRNDLVIASTGPTLDLDYRDNVLNPTSGHFSRLTLEYATRALGSTNTDDFLRATAQTTAYTTLFEQLVWANSLRGGYLSPLKIKPDGVRFDKKGFILGGRTTVRGFESSEFFPSTTALGPSYLLSGNTSYELFKSEVRFPLLRKSDLYGALFYDGGRVNIDELAASIDYKSEWRSSIGIGIRYNLPIGPLNLEYARKLDKKSYESEGAFHLSVGVF